MSAVNSVALSETFLERFLQAATVAAVPLVAELEPGLSDHEISDLGETLGIEIPAEIRTLWRWRTASAFPSHAWSWQANPQVEIWPPRHAIAETIEYREELDVEPGLFDAPPTGLCFGGTPSGLFVDAKEQTPVHSVGYFVVDHPEFLSVAPSVGALFEHWTAQLQAGE